MIENEDKLPKNNLKRLHIEIFHILENIYLILISILNNYLEALLLEYIGFTQYEIHF